MDLMAYDLGIHFHLCQAFFRDFCAEEDDDKVDFITKCRRQLKTRMGLKASDRKVTLLHGLFVFWSKYISYHDHDDIIKTSMFYNIISQHVAFSFKTQVPTFQFLIRYDRGEKVKENEAQSRYRPCWPIFQICVNMFENMHARWKNKKTDTIC